MTWQSDVYDVRQFMKDVDYLVCSNGSRAYL